MGPEILIYERDAVIAEDISETITGAFEAVQMALTTTFDDALAALANVCRRPAVAILHATEAELRQLVSANIGGTATGSIIAIHTGISDPDLTDVIFVPPPFDSETLLWAVTRAMQTNSPTTEP